MSYTKMIADSYINRTLIDTSAGNTCTDRGSNISFSDSTVIINENPVSQSGNVTSWCLFKASATGQARLKVFRSNGANWNFVGQSNLENITSGGLNTFTTNIAVQAGDYIGAYLALGGTGLDATTNIGGDLYYRYDGNISSNVAKNDGQTLGHRLSLGATVSTSLVTNYLDLIVEPWPWYTPGGAATEILAMISDINGAILNFFAEYGIVDYTYINTEVFTRGNNVIIRVNLTSTGLATMFPLFIKIIVLLVAVGVIIVGIGPILDWYWGETSQGLTNQQLTDAGEELIVDTADGIKDACESDITLTQDQKVNCIKNQTDNLLDKWKNYQQKVYPDADHTPLDNARTKIQQCQDTYNSSSKTTADYETFKTCIATETNNAIGEDKDNTLEVYPGDAPAGSKEKPTDWGKLLLYTGLGIVGLVIITRK